MAKEKYKKKDTLQLEGVTSAELATVKPPNYAGNLYEMFNVDEEPTFEPYSYYRSIAEFGPHESLVEPARLESEIPFYDRDPEGRSTASRSDRMRILPNKHALLYNIFMRLGSRANTVVDFLANPGVLVSQEQEDEAIREYYKHVEGYVERWEAINNQQYPIEALEKMNTPEFAEWWYADPMSDNVPKGASSVVDPSMPKGIALPEIVVHGTYHIISRKDGFMQLNANEFPVPKGREEWELQPHMGTGSQALDIVFEKRQNQVFDTGVLPHREHLPEYMRDNPDAFERAPGEKAKFYPGWIKMNNPFVIPYEIPHQKGWVFEALMHQLTQPADGGPPNVISTYDEDGNEIFINENPSTLEEHGFYYDPISQTGSAIDRIMEYAKELAREDGKIISFEDLSDEEADKMYSNLDPDELEELPTKVLNDEKYYRNMGFFKFMQDDLGYDGIKYFNQVEDKMASDWSYILFSPNQFKSIYNEGTFKWKDEKGKPVKDFMSKTTKTSKYKKVA